MQKICLLFCLFTLLSSCTPTPRKVSEAIGRGNLDQSVQLLSRLLNRDGEISEAKLQRLLHALSISHRFELEQADELLFSTKKEARKTLLKWYLDQYLKATENAIQAHDFDKARQIWKQQASVLHHTLPDFEPSVPVLGLIDLREAEYLLTQKQTQAACQAFQRAKKELSHDSPFDQIRYYAFIRWIEKLKKDFKSCT